MKVRTPIAAGNGFSENLLESKGWQPSKKTARLAGPFFQPIFKRTGQAKNKTFLTGAGSVDALFWNRKTKANAIQQLINKTDKEIDEIVYELYGLTEEERRVVEEG